MGGSASSALVNVYTGFTGPSSFGTGSGTPITSGSGDRFGINDVHQDGLPGLTLPVGYVTGTELTAADTYNDKSSRSRPHPRDIHVDMGHWVARRLLHGAYRPRAFIRGSSVDRSRRRLPRLRLVPPLPATAADGSSLAIPA